jgi:hypothetical protein
MLKAVKWGTATLAAIACLAMAACGSGSKEDVVVRVGKNTISSATVDHWIQVESVTSHGGARATPQPKGVLPVPPKYTDCIAYLMAHPQAGYSKPSPEEARVKCAVEYKLYKETILYILINYYWDVEEGAAKGVRVSDAEVTRYIKGVYPHPGEFGRFLRISHERLADERMLVKGKLMTKALVDFSARNAHSGTERLHAIAKHVEEETARWTPRTSCSVGYVVAQCKQFHGPQA